MTRIMTALFVLLGLTLSPKQAPATADDTLREMQAERIQVLTEMVDLAERFYEEGNMALDGVLSAQSDLMNARMEYAESEEELILILEQALELATSAEDVATKRFEAGFSNSLGVLAARSYRLKIEIDLRRIRLPDDVD